MIEVKHSMSSLKEEQESQRFRRNNRHVNVTRLRIIINMVRLYFDSIIKFISIHTD